MKFFFLSLLGIFVLAPLSFAGGYGPGEAERASLNQVVVELNHIEALVRQAKANQNPTNRAQLDYITLLLDLDRVRDGIADHLDKPWIGQRGVNALPPVSGHYGAHE